MDDMKDMLDELRKISQYLEHQENTKKREKKLSLIIALIGISLILGIILLSIVLDKTKSKVDPKVLNWYSIERSLDSGELDEALAGAKILVARVPNYYYGYKVLGSIYLAKNDLKNAKDAYEKACNLFPYKTAKETLEAVNERVETEKRGNK